MELWDAYDENVNLIEGVTLTRGEKIDDGIFHLVCDIIVRHTDGDYLIMQRDARVVDENYHSAYVVYLCVTGCDKDSVKLQDGETSDFCWVDKDTLLNMKNDELITERMELFLDELKG